MKVIFVTREGYNLAGGRIRAYGFARELARRGIDAQVLSYAQDLGARDGVEEGLMGPLEKIKYNIRAYKKLSRERNAIIVLQRVNYHFLAPLISHVRKGNRLVLDIDDWEIRENPRYIFGIYPTSKAEYLTRKIASMSDFCVAGSVYLKNFIYKFNKDVYYVPSCVDAGLFQPNGKIENAHDVRFAWVGTLHRKDDVENVRFIIDCFKELKRKIGYISMDIVGDGIYTKEIAAYISNYRMGDSVNFRGWVHPDKMPFCLNGIDIGLCPLIQDTKFNLSKSPAKLLEYMSMERPAISSHIGEAGLIVEDGKDGFLAKDRQDFIGKMEILATDSRLREEMGKNARIRILQNYSLSLAGDRLSTIFMERYGRG